MSVRKTSGDILKLTEKSVTKFQAGTVTTQTNVMRRVNTIIRSLELNADNTILINTKNLKLLRELGSDLEKIIVDPGYRRKVAAYLKTFGDVKKLQEGAYAAVAGFNPASPVFTVILENNVAVAAESLLASGISQSVVSPIIKILNDSITTGAFIADMEESLRVAIVGDSSRLGSLERYTSQITRDALNQYSRNYSEAISMDLDMEWYYYSGSIIDDTRSYCVERAGQYFHKSEVENVPSEWAGRIPGTNSSTIFIWAGGYNCRHLWMPVLIDVVPNHVIERNR